MYPVLVATGGLSTLAWDFRRQILSFLAKFSHRTQRKRRPSPSVPASSNEEIQLRDMSEQAGITESQNNVNTTTTRNRIRGTTVSNNSTTTNNKQEQEEEQTVTDNRMLEYEMMVLKKKLAIPLAISSILIIITLVIVKAELSSPPRWLDFFVNMITAGVIIFGGGPVVIPLLRQYTVAPGKFQVQKKAPF